MPRRIPRITLTTQAAAAVDQGTAALPALHEALHSHNEELRQTAAWAVGQIGSSESVPFLVAALSDADWLVRKNALTALGKIRDSAAVPRILSLLNDSDSRLRAEAAEVLGILGDKQAVEPLQACLKDEEFARLPKFGDLRVGEVVALALEKLTAS